MSRKNFKFFYFEEYDSSFFDSFQFNCEIILSYQITCSDGRVFSVYENHTFIHDFTTTNLYGFIVRAMLNDIPKLINQYHIDSSTIIHTCFTHGEIIYE